MILKNKKALILSSLLILLPIPVGLLLWDRFPEQMAIHWGINGQADGYASVPFAVFVLPLILLAGHWLCILFTSLDKRNQNRNHKPMLLMLSLMPVISNLTSGILYALALGADFSATSVMNGAFGLMFIVLGNYMPKCRMNSTMGIKVPWTYSSEENWNATHRFGGKVWVIGGLIMVFGALLPGEWGIAVMFVDIVVLCVIPIVYSYRFYKKELAEGKVLTTGYSTIDKKILKGSGIFLVVILIFVAYVMFAGDITYHYREDHLFIEASMYNDHVVYYDDMESVQWHEGNIPGLRVGGFGSARLLMGFFENEEFGTYTRYTYTKPEACVLVQVKNRILVLSGETYEETQALYQNLLVLTQTE